MSMIFGLGSGRCGTRSLATLLNSQKDTVCFHEANPSGMAWCGAEDAVKSLLRDFEAILSGDENRGVTVDLASPYRAGPLERLHGLDRVQAIGDVGIYYLPYVEMIIERIPYARFPCLKREKTQVVASYLEKLGGVQRDRSVFGVLKDSLKGRRRLNRSRNHWASPADQRWLSDPRWDKCFPSYEGMTGQGLAEFIGRFYDEYYEKVLLLEAKFPAHVKLFDIEVLNDEEGRRDLLAFCLPNNDPVNIKVHENIGIARG